MYNPTPSAISVISPMAQIKAGRIYDPTPSAISVISPMAQVKARRILNSVFKDFDLPRHTRYILYVHRSKFF